MSGALVGRLREGSTDPAPLSLREFGHEFGIDDEEFQCTAGCAEQDPRFRGMSFRQRPGVVRSEPFMSGTCGTPLGNALSERGSERARELVRTLAGWRGDMLADVYDLWHERLALPQAA